MNDAVQAEPKIRHKIEKKRNKVTNWRDRHNALRKHGDFTLYFTEEAIADWHTANTGVRGCPLSSAFAIEASLMIRRVFRLPNRQTQGYLNVLVMALDIETQHS
jgi:Transposase DDE domain